MKPDIAENIAVLSREARPYNAKIILITKKRTVDEMLAAVEAGITDLGENRVQELNEKLHAIPENVTLHFVGHLQRNKVKDILPHVQYIHSGDSVRLINAIEKAAKKSACTVNVLLQVHIAKEESKYGFKKEEVLKWLDSGAYNSLEHVKIAGVMGMATFTENMELVRNEFKSLKQFFTLLKEKYFPENESFKEISMGMSGDYPIALEEGATMIRVGQVVFGKRPE